MPPYKDTIDSAAAAVAAAVAAASSGQSYSSAGNRPRRTVARPSSSSSNKMENGRRSPTLKSSNWNSYSNLSGGKMSGQKFLVEAEAQEEELEVDYDEGVTELYAAITSCDWERAIRAARENPIEARTWVVRRHRDEDEKKKRPSSRNGPSTGAIMWRFLPIHSACARQPPEAVIGALLRANPDGAAARDDQGMYPLHYACGNQASPETIRLLLLANPEAACAADPTDMLPIHYLAQWGPSDRGVADMLLFANRAVADAQDVDGATPLDLAYNADYDERHEVMAAIQRLAQPGAANVTRFFAPPEEDQNQPQDPPSLHSHRTTQLHGDHPDFNEDVIQAARAADNKHERLFDTPLENGDSDLKPTEGKEGSPIRHSPAYRSNAAEAPTSLTANSFQNRTHIPEPIVEESQEEEEVDDEAERNLGSSAEAGGSALEDPFQLTPSEAELVRQQELAEARAGAALASSILSKRDGGGLTAIPNLEAYYMMKKTLGEAATPPRQRSRSIEGIPKNNSNAMSANGNAVLSSATSAVLSSGSSAVLSSGSSAVLSSGSSAVLSSGANGLASGPTASAIPPPKVTRIGRSTKSKRIKDDYTDNAVTQDELLMHVESMGHSAASDSGLPLMQKMTIAKLKAEVAKQRAERNFLEAEIEEKMTNERESMKSAIVDLQSKLEDLAAENERLAKEKRTRDEFVRYMEGKLAERDYSLTKTQSDLNEATAELRECKAQLSERTERVSVLELRLKELSTALHSMVRNHDVVLEAVSRQDEVIKRSATMRQQKLQELIDQEVQLVQNALEDRDGGAGEAVDLNGVTTLSKALEKQREEMRNAVAVLAQSRGEDAAAKTAESTQGASEPKTEPPRVEDIVPLNLEETKTEQEREKNEEKTNAL